MKVSLMRYLIAIGLTCYLLVLGIKTDAQQQQRLNSSKNEENGIYATSSRLFVVSDIEGELSKFKALLIGNGVIDEKENWTYGDAQLVICGDLVDRGGEVFELLTFLQHLETKAIKESGKVHVILGNHDIMNFAGDFRYVNKKYLDTDGKPFPDYINLFSNASITGKWLRSKNVVEKIGELLFLHGGISPEVLSLGKSIGEINGLCKKCYGIKNSDLPDSVKVFFGNASPFWFRGYFIDPKVSEEHVDRTLAFYSLKHIFVGHTIMPDNIMVYYGKKVIGIDVDYHKDSPSALILDKYIWKVVNTNGHKIKLLSIPPYYDNTH